MVEVTARRLVADRTRNQAPPHPNHELRRMKLSATPSITIALAACALLAQAHALTGEPTTTSDALGTPASLYFGDVDGDGLDDAFVVSPTGQASLLFNRGSGLFDDITLASGLAQLEGSTCALFADFDGDGHLDLFVGSSEQRLWRNLGNASFEAVDSGIDHDLVDLAATAVDADKDGLLDIHVHTEAGDLLYRNTGHAKFERVELPMAGHPAHETTILDTGDDTALAGREPRDETPTRRRLRRWLRARANANPSSSAAGANNAISGNPAMLATCPVSLKDVATGSCISASSTPLLGTLYPLSTNFDVTASGAIGMGTTAPLGNLDIVRSSARVRIGASGNNETAALSLLENNSETSGFDVRYEGNLNQFQIAARDGTATPVSRLAVNRTNGNVGIGTTAPAQKLDVAGNALVSGSVTGSTIASTIATGTAPLSVASTTKVTSLNADMLDGLDSAAFTQLGNSIESSEITNGTITTADIGQNGATSGQTLKWSGSAWAPSADASGPWSSSFGDTYVASGNVGIGTNSPSFTVDVQSPTTATLRMNSPNGTVQSLTQSGNGFDISANAGGYAIGRHNIDWLFSLDYASGNAWLGNSLGIGTTTPTSPLTVAGTIESTSGGIKFPDGTVQTTASVANTANQYLALGPGDFLPLDSNDRVVNSWYDGVWAYSGELVAPIHLPDGAQITGVRLTGFDTLATVNLAVEIDSKVRNGISSATVYSHTFPATGGYFDQNTVAGPITVDNANFTRFIGVYPVGGGWPGTSALSITSLIVEWSMP